MTVDNIKVIDAIGIENSTGNVVLTITDHLDWDTDVEAHMLQLQEKLNTYLAFVESGEIMDAYPDARDRAVVIEVICKYSPTESARNFLDRAAAVAEGAGMEFRTDVYSGSE